MAWITTTIKKGDIVKVINKLDLYCTKFPTELELGECYEVLDVCDDYFNGAFLILKTENSKLSVYPKGFSYDSRANTDRFEIVGKPGRNSGSI
jgi:hypothetical protein